MRKSYDALRDDAMMEQGEKTAATASSDDEGKGRDAARGEQKADEQRAEGTSVRT